MTPAVGRSANSGRLGRADGGGAIVVLVITIAVLLMFAALAVDIGRAFAFRAQLQATTDAAALAAANVLPVKSDSLVAAEKYTNLNLPTSTYGMIVKTAGPQAGVTFGRWDPTARTFAPNPTPAAPNTMNAVRVHGQATRLNGNPLDTFLADVMGISSMDVSTSSIAQRTNTFYCGFIGLSSVKISGSAITDSFDSALGRDSIGGEHGTVCSNGDIRLSGNVEVHGDAVPGHGTPTHHVNFSGGASVSGITDPNISLLSFPAPDLSVVEVINNNVSIGLTDGGNDPLDSDPDFTLSGGDSITLQPGTYYFEDIKLTGNSTLNIVGPVKIYVAEDCDLEGGNVTNESGVPADLRIEALGDVKLNGGSELAAVIYAPTSEVTRTGSAAFYGSIIADELVMSGGSEGSAGAHYDVQLGIAPLGKAKCRLVG